MAALWLHYEGSTSAPEFTLKLGLSGAAVTVSDALARFATAYASTGYSLAKPTAGNLSLADADGTPLAPSSILPCGLSPGADAFVTSESPPTQLPTEAAAAQAATAKAAFVAAARPQPASNVGAVLTPMHSVAQSAATAAATAAAAAGSGEEARQKGVYAKPGSAIAASQAKMGENSYYYSVGRNKPGAASAGGAAATAPAEAPKMMPKKVVARAAGLTEQTISSYSMLDDGDVVKVHLPLAGAGSLPVGAISCDFRERSFDLRVTVAEQSKVLRLHIPILLEEIDAEGSSIKKKVSKLILVLKKAKPDSSWYELRKTKGVGDSEYHKLVPDAGDAVTFTL